MDATGKGDSAKATRKGINWMTYIGLLILLVLIVGIAYLMMIWNQGKDNRLIQSIADLAPSLKEMEGLTKSQIRDQARGIEAKDLAADPAGWSDMYYMVEGVVSSESTGSIDKNIALNVFSDTKFKGFMLDDAVVLIDLTGTAPDVPDGTVIRGYGKIFTLDVKDVWKLPVVGPNLKKEFDTPGMDQRVAFFLSQGIDIVSVPRKGGGPPVPPAQAGGPPGEADKTAPPADASTTPPAGTETAPPAGETTPPAGGETKPPEGGGTTPPPAAPPAAPPTGGGK